MVVTIERRTPLSPQQAWAAITDFSAHAASVPFTRMLTDPQASEPGPGWRFIARTKVGPFTLDDPMRITRWSPPGTNGLGLFRADKLGPVLAGWTVARARPSGDDGASGGCIVTWTQQVRPRIWLPPPGALVADLASQWLYGHAIDVLLAAHIARHACERR